MLTKLVASATIFCASLFAASPTITGVVNSASLIPPGLPNYGIAQGSIFNVFGTNLGPSSLTEAPSLPLPPTLGGTTVTITVGSTTVTAPMFYSYQAQLAAILPSNTPVGTGTLTVSFGGSAGTSPITVVQSNVGIYTANQSGGGAGVVTFSTYQSLTSTSSTKAGDVLIIWATGLGPITGSDASAPTEIDLGTPIQVYVGGVQATVLYRGRSSFAGLDQINFTMPQGVSPGCGVSLVIQTNNLVSNNTSIPVSTDGGTCSDPTITQPSPTPPTGTTGYKSGILSLLSETETTAVNGVRSTNTILAAGASFERITTTPSNVVPATSLTSATTTTASLGSCSVTVVSESLTSGSGGSPTGGGGGATATALDAGASLSLTPPSGSALTLQKQSSGLLYLGTPTTLSGGTYQFSNRTGGADIGPFITSFAMPTPLVWTNQNVANGVIDRTQPLTITWTGGASNGYVDIDLSSLFSTTSTVTEATVLCIAPVSAGQFTIPPSVLLSLIPTPSGSALSESLVSVVESGVQSLTIPGLDFAEGVWEFLTGVATTFK